MLLTQCVLTPFFSANRFCFLTWRPNQNQRVFLPRTWTTFLLPLSVSPGRDVTDRADVRMRTRQARSCFGNWKDRQTAEIYGFRPIIARIGQHDRPSHWHITTLKYIDKHVHTGTRTCSLESHSDETCMSLGQRRSNP